MMKVALLFSVIFNVVLGYLLMSRKPETVIEERERLIIETHPHHSSPPHQEKVLEEKNEAKEGQLRDGRGEVQDLQDAGEKMEADRQEFFSEVLGMNEEKIAKHRKLRDEFFGETTRFWKKNSMRELSFEERRKLLLLEEEFHRKLQKLHGKKNWETYLKFREEYNARGHKKQMEEGEPFLFMGI